MNTPEITQEEQDRFQDIFSHLAEKTGATLILLVDKSGYLLFQQGETEWDATTLGTLAGNAFNATAALSKLAGDSGCETFFQSGKDFSLLTCNINESLVLVVVFASDIPVTQVEWQCRPAVMEAALQMGLAEARPQLGIFNEGDGVLADLKDFKF